MDEETKPKIGLYSAEACQKFGSSIYQHEDGREVEVTCVIDDVDKYGWKDKIVVGPVTRWLRNGSPRNGGPSFITLPATHTFIDWKTS